MRLSDLYGEETNICEAKRKREEDLERAEKTANNINKYFSKGHTAAAPKPKVSEVTSNPAIAS